MWSFLFCEFTNSVYRGLLTEYYILDASYFPLSRHIVKKRFKFVGMGFTKIATKSQVAGDRS